MLTRGGFDMIKVLKNYSAKSERRVFLLQLIELVFQLSVHSIQYITSPIYRKGYLTFEIKVEKIVLSHGLKPMT